MHILGEFFAASRAFIYLLRTLRTSRMISIPHTTFSTFVGGQQKSAIRTIFAQAGAIIICKTIDKYEPDGAQDSKEFMHIRILSILAKELKLE